MQGVDEAQSAGFRACRRCLPDGVAKDEAAVRLALTAIGAGEGHSLADLALRTGYSPAHLQRMFTRTTGLSPAVYARNLREERAREELSGGGRVVEAIYAAGYESPSRFYEAMEGKLGMAASAWRKGGAGVAIRWAIVPTSLGEMLVAATDKGVCRLSFAEGREELARRFPKAELVEGGAEFAELLERVARSKYRPIFTDPSMVGCVPHLRRSVELLI